MLVWICSKMGWLLMIVGFFVKLATCLKFGMVYLIVPENIEKRHSLN